MDIITSHLNADFDSFGSMIAAQKVYPGARLVFPGSQEKSLRDFIAAFHPVKVDRIKDLELAEVRRLIIVDARTSERIGPLSVLLTRPTPPEIHIYDHHPSTDADLKGSFEAIEKVGATATLFTEILKAKKIEITPIEATALCLGIYEETGALLFPSTTERDLLAAAWLLKRGASLKIVSNFIRIDLGREEFELLNELLKTSEVVEVSGVRVKIAKASREEYAGDAAQIAHRIMDIDEIDAVILILNMQGKLVLISRSKAPELDVAELMQSFGGGGHPTAASATVREASPEVIEDRIKTLLKTSVKPGKCAADIMNTPVITINWTDSVKNAESMMTRYGVNVLPVIKDNLYNGIISREAVEKAIFHGFGNNKVSDFTTTDVLTVSSAAPIRDIERLMIEQNQRFMPVLENARIIGAITRTDILRTLYEDMLKRRSLGEEAYGDKPSIGRNLATWLKERFPSEVSDMLGSAGETADDLGFSAYLVGGSVRDLLRGQENLDIDLVVEGDGIMFAREFGKRLDAAVKTHERFGTAQVFAGGLRIDVATARTEYYESPAALPTVETSSIKKDLYRRDFTINTLAVKLNKKDFGLLIDFFGGQRDLKEKTIRVLHNLSFIEDPTRAFRAIRFSERFGFKLSRHTEDLIKSTVRMNLFDRLSGSRLFDELIMTFDETEPVRAIKRLSEYKLLSVIHPNLVFDKKLEANFQATHDTLSWFKLLFLGEEPNRPTLYLMTLLSGLTDRDREAALLRLSAPSRVRTKITGGMLSSKAVLSSLPLRDPVKVYKTMSSLNIETLLFMMALTPDINRKKEISRYILELRTIKPLIKGSDLQKLGLPPGPLFSKALGIVLEEKLKGKLLTKEDELAFVRKQFF